MGRNGFVTVDVALKITGDPVTLSWQLKPSGGQATTVSSKTYTLPIVDIVSGHLTDSAFNLIRLTIFNQGSNSSQRILRFDDLDGDMTQTTFDTGANDLVLTLVAQGTQSDSTVTVFFIETEVYSGG